MHFAPADHFDDGMPIFARVDDLAADFQTNFVDHAQDVALGYGRIRPHDKVRACQRIEVCGVVGDVESAVKQLAQHFGCARRINVVNRISCFCSSHVVRFRTYTADAVGQQWHFFHRAANAKAFKSAQFGDLEIGVGNVPFLVEEDFDLAVPFQAGDGIDGYSLLIMVPPIAFSQADLPL